MNDGRIERPAAGEVGGVLFDAVLQPHASLSANGFVVLMGLLSGTCFATGVVFVVAGAWPVSGFFGLDVALVYLALRISYRRARRYETLRLTEAELRVERIDPRGARRRWRFQPYWLRVALDQRARPQGRLTLSSHGRTLEIGAFLAPWEKRDLARALRAALARLRGEAV